MPRSNTYRCSVLPVRAARGSADAAWALLLAITAIVLLLASATEAQAQGAERWAPLAHTAFKHHQHADMSGAEAIVQDRQGFVWIGTQAGLLRWDGTRHIRYLADPDRSDTLPDSYILSLHIDSRERLWVGMNSGGVARYDAERDTFVRYRTGTGMDGQANGDGSAIADDGTGGVLVGHGTGIDRIDASGAVSHLTYAEGTIPAGGINRLLRAADGRLWIGTERGLFLLDAQRRLRPVALGDAGLPALAVIVLFQDSAGRIWIGTRANGAFLLDPATLQAAPVQEHGPAASLPTDRVTAIIEVAPDELWFGTDGGAGGILVFDARSGASRRIRHSADAADSLPDNNIMTMFRERGGIVLVATMGCVSQHGPVTGAITTVRHLGQAGSGILSVPAMMQAPDGRMWLSIAGGGVTIVDPVSGRVTAVPDLAKGRVLAIAPGPDGDIYLGTQQGLYRADADGRRARLVPVPGRGPDVEVWALAWSDRVLWLGGLDGVWALQLQAPGGRDMLRLLRHEMLRLGDHRVTALLAAGNDLWVGTRTGVARLDRYDHAAIGVEVLPTELATPDRLAPGYVSSLLVDRQGRLWLSNFGTGVILLERTDADGRRRMRRFGRQQGMPDNGVNKLLEDGDGAIWASTETGLARIDPRTLAVMPLGAGDGVQVPVYWTNSGTRTAAGELVFGGLTGLTVLRPRALAPWRYAPPVAVTRILLGDREIPGSIYNLAGRKAAPITVTPEGRERGFSLEFAALDYSAPERNRYAYQLKGFDRDWIATDAATRRASYTNLPPGDYMLLLRGSNRSGEWSAPLEVPVRVLTAWHQQPWARLSAVLLAAALLAGLMQLRTRYLRRRQRELEAMVQARTAELRATQAQLETLAYSDALTGLANRRLFSDELRLLVAQTERGGPAFTLLLIDLDHFKPVNDTYGHDAGDALLVAAAGRLLAAVRESDRVFRLGGDEFAVLLGQATDRATLAPMCARMLHDLAQPLLLPAGATIEISASVGAAVHQRGHSHEQLYKQADVALYRAKAAGRNAWWLAEDPG
nr:ligand-binding sensor domain-containing diguanylate cyclase [Duganella sp. Leaf61]